MDQDPLVYAQNESVGNVMTADEMHNLSKAQQFKEDLSAIRLMRIDLVQQGNAIIGEIKRLTQASEETQRMFESEAMTMYPELHGQDIFTAMESLVMDHPLRQLWDQYAQKFTVINEELSNDKRSLDKVNEDFASLTNQEAGVLESYRIFAESASTVVPTYEEMMTDMDAVEAIPYAEVQPPLNMSAIEMLSPEAAAMVTLQSLENASADGYASDEEPLDSQGLFMDKSQVEATPEFIEADKKEKLKKYAGWAAAASIVYLMLS